MLQIGCAIRFDWAMLIFIHRNPDYLTINKVIQEAEFMNDLLTIALEEMSEECLEK